MPVVCPQPPPSLIDELVGELADLGDDAVPIEDTLGALDRLVQEGKIRHEALRRQRRGQFAALYPDAVATEAVLGAGCVLPPMLETIPSDVLCSPTETVRSLASLQVSRNEFVDFVAVERFIACYSNIGTVSRDLDGAGSRYIDFTCHPMSVACALIFSPFESVDAQAACDLSVVIAGPERIKNPGPPFGVRTSMAASTWSRFGELSVGCPSTSNLTPGNPSAR